MPPAQMHKIARSMTHSVLLYEVSFANMGSQHRKYTISIKDNTNTNILILILIIVMIGIVKYQVPVIKQINTET